MLSFTETIRGLRQVEAVAIDIETTGFDVWQGDVVRGISLATNEWSTYLPISHPESDNLTKAEYQQLLAVLSSTELLIGWNLPFDLSFLIYDGLDITHVSLYDGMVMHWLENENRRMALKEAAGDTEEQDKLKDVMKAHCRICGSPNSKQITKKEAEEAGDMSLWKQRACLICRDPSMWQLKRGWGELTYEDIKDYAVKDAEMTFKLWERQRRFDSVSKEVFEREMQLCLLGLEMTQRGLGVNVGLAQSELDRLEKEIESVANRYDGVNLGSPKQVGQYLSERGVKLPRKETTGAIETGTDSLLPHQGRSEAVADILRYRKLKKERELIQQLIDNLGSDGRIHPRWRTTGTVSGRWSCSDPNLMQLPRAGRVRELIQAPEGFRYVSIDLSQAELRVNAWYAQAPQLIKWFNEGTDVYQQTADKMGTDRQTAKIVVLGTGYGAGPRKLRMILLRGGVDVSAKRAKELWEEWRKVVPELPAFRDKAEKVAWKRGYVKLIHEGRVRRFPAGDWKAHPKDAANALMQGGVAEMMKTWMLALTRMDMVLVGQIHDAVVLQVPEDDKVGLVRMAEREWQRVCEMYPIDLEMPTESKVGL